MSREVVLDTETTGIDPAEGHRIIEIGCVELYNHMPTGKVWHHYINPEREVDAGAVAVHGIKTEFLKDKPVFGELVGSFLDFIGDSPMIIHNAEFDIKFLNAEIKNFGFPPFKIGEAIDTLLIARKKYPGSPANLDALCRRFNIDLSGRDFHGALLDAQLLALVYLELLGGRQHGLGLGSQSSGSPHENKPIAFEARPKERILRTARSFPAHAEEIDAHQKMCSSLKNSMWDKSQGKIS